jgi:hypothetical protein
MGMIGCFSAIDAKELDAIQDDPSLMEDFLYPDDDLGEPEHSIDVDKAWHGLHYLLSGSASEGEGPLAQAILGGESIGEDLGMGPARFLTPRQVGEIAEELGKLTIEDLRARYKPVEMTALQIYPELIWERDGEEGFDYLAENFEVMATFYRDAAARGDGVILSIA